MHPVRISAHYGQPIILEQCSRCGGVWFDELELFSAKHGEAEKIELVDSQALRKFSTVRNAMLKCPKDDSVLVRFEDNYFPADIIMESCRVCRGFWLNRGEFGRYQKARAERTRPKVKSVADQKFEESIERLLSLHQDRGALDVLGKLGMFLSTPLDPLTLRAVQSSERSPAENRTLDVTLNVLTSVLNLLIRR